MSPCYAGSALKTSIDMIRSLVGFPTVSRDSNLELIDFARETLRPHGADVRLTFDDDRRKANLFATLGPRIEGGLVLSGHTDVVPDVVVRRQIVEMRVHGRDVGRERDAQIGGTRSGRA